MATGALFSNAAGSRTQTKNLVEFRAGKMYMKGKMVHPDKRKGLVYVYQSSDSLMHFCWKDRGKGPVEDDLIIFPDDCEFQRVKQCTTGRVYLLKFRLTNRKMFFWMQEPKTDSDEDFCSQVNKFLNNPPTPGSSRGGGSSSTSNAGFGGLPPELTAGLGADSDLQSILGNMNQQQLMHLLGTMGMNSMGGLSAMMGGRPGSSSQSETIPPSRVQSSPGGSRSSSAADVTPQRPSTTLPPGATSSSSPLPAPPAVAEERRQTRQSARLAQQAAQAGSGSSAYGRLDMQLSDHVKLSDLQTILSGMQGPSESRDPVDLSSALTAEAMIPILANRGVQERLVPFLPEGAGTLPTTEAELRETVQSAQFQQAMTSFSAALASGQLGPLMGQFGLGDAVATAAGQGDVEGFVAAMQAAMADKKSSDDVEMAEDKPK